MAFQNVGRPRFFVDLFTWWHSLKLLETYDVHTVTENKPEWLGLNPSTIGSFESSTSGSYRNWLRFMAFAGNKFNIPDTENMTNTSMFAAILGHNFASVEKGFSTAEIDAATMDVSGDVNIESIVNDAGGQSAGDADVSYDGFSLRTFDPQVTEITGVHFRVEGNAQNGGGGTVKIGSCAYGVAYKMPNAPNLSLTMSREYGSTKEFTTLNGSSISNTMWSSPPKWGDLGAWELSKNGSENQAASRTSRRTWQLQFSFMDDSDLWGSNQMLSKIRYDISDGTDAVDYMSGDDNLFVDNLLTNDNFFSQVWHKTLGGTLPFIFQQDSSINDGYNNPDQFAICRFKDNSLKATQSAPNLYDISLSIEEVW